MLNAAENSRFIQIDAQINAYQKTLQDIRQTYFDQWRALEFNP